MKKAEIVLVKAGRRKGEFRFRLKAKNGEIIATSGSESYKQKQSCIKTLSEHFPEFAIFDLTLV